MEGNEVSVDCGLGFSLSLVWKHCICGVISDKKHEQNDKNHTSSFLCQLCGMAESKSPDGQVTSGHSEEHIHPYIPSPWGLWECQDCKVILLFPSARHSDFLVLQWWAWPTQAMWCDRSNVGLWATKTTTLIEIRRRKTLTRLTQTHKTDLKLLIWMNPMASQKTD